jgi:hypothetical protein
MKRVSRKGAKPQRLECGKEYGGKENEFTGEIIFLSPIFLSLLLFFAPWRLCVSLRVAE